MYSIDKQRKNSHELRPKLTCNKLILETKGKKVTGKKGMEVDFMPSALLARKICLCLKRVLFQAFQCAIFRLPSAQCINAMPEF